jgi:hypothetical protein
MCSEWANHCLPAEEGKKITLLVGDVIRGMAAFPQVVRVPVEEIPAPRPAKPPRPRSALLPDASLELFAPEPPTADEK